MLQTTERRWRCRGAGTVGLASIDLVAVESSLHRLYEMVRTADLGPSEGLIGPLADARAEVDELLDRYEPSLGEAAEVASGLRSFSRTPAT
ncbi:MAG: hypothetical protein R2710_19235 [Acidimicrobiales bacterium]